MKIRKISILMLMVATVLLTISVGSRVGGESDVYSFGHFYYRSHEGYASICGYLGRETEVEIPSTIAGKPVSEIESGAFDGCGTIKVITIPDTVVIVYDDSFTGATSLEKIITYTVGIDIKAGSDVTIEYINDKKEEDPSADAERFKKYALVAAGTMAVVTVIVIIWNRIHEGR